MAAERSVEFVCPPFFIEAILRQPNTRKFYAIYPLPFKKGWLSTRNDKPRATGRSGGLGVFLASNDYYFGYPLKLGLFSPVHLFL